MFVCTLQVVSAGSETFHFKILPDQGCCSVVRNKHGQGIATVEGQVAHKLQPLKNMRGATPPLPQMQIPKPMPQQPAPKHAKHTQPVVASAGNRMPVNSTTTIAAPEKTKKDTILNNNTTKPSTSRPVSIKRVDISLQTASRDKPGGAPNGRALAAAHQNNLRLVLIALLAQRPSTMRGIKTAITALETAAPKFRPPIGKGDVEQALKTVAVYKAPGMYVLKQGLESEIQHLASVSPSPPPESTTAVAATGPSKKKRPRSGSDSEDGSPSLDARRRSTPDAPSTDEGTGASSLRRTTSRPLSASSRGSGGADESWVLEHTERLPEPAPSISSLEEYGSVDAEFRRRHEVYFKLHQLLASNRKEFEALQAAVDDAPSVEEQARLEEEVRRLWERRAGRARQWEAAFCVLQKELEAWKAALMEYSNRHKISPSPVPGSKPDATSSGSEREQEEASIEEEEEI